MREVLISVFDEILIMPKMGQMEDFWDQNQHFGTFLKIFLLDLPEINPHDSQ